MRIAEDCTLPVWFKPKTVTPRRPQRRVPPGRLKLGPYAGSHSELQPSATICFRFGTRIIRAIARPNDGVHTNVLRVQIPPSIVQRLVQAMAGLLPSVVGNWIRSTFPEWNLPPRVVLKMQKKGWDKDFDTKKAVYAKLQLLQGVAIPEFLGELRYNGTRAILLSDIGGACLITPEGALLEVAEVRRLLGQAFAALAQFRVSQDDAKLDNFHIVQDRIMVVDMERVVEDLTDTDLDIITNSTVNFLARLYQDHQYSLWTDGFIAVDTQDTT
ncbi:Protein kinase domain-containing protein [Madurella fahalii]|uniref:Protein kinase domain-containing protein n=1 Tax=Madurella fahalii TaxID=1157608 RepID=A0ABQ0G4X2_9PEZI